ncbi:probable NOT transcription complex subunit VIP2 isoform X2 [Ananas comosus]|uniref:Probable NOT transcription complex subunit VIP2 isoform X2 n=1 Tax=Ananas comosus TaxID=4615 RepID=A0A6P5HF29_ANACO|nr:probable NOT transcription complex subunit VIP2 isoform X2 [Ananas comosus]XP_020113986.1 probable NOT transcription complex subunit VIP2 isoform X2 [Ananas comosus]XP_020113987.1 probable NOT transcription complex subunit VIP2 isoform X2 [Ananas comosus]
MSGLLNSNLNGSSSNLPDSTGRPFATSFSAHSASVPGFHSGAMQGLHNIHGTFNLPNMPSSLTQRHAAMSGIPSTGVQQPGGSISSGRFASNNHPVSISQIPHGHSGVTSRGGMGVVGNPAFSSGMNSIGGSIPGISSSSGTGGNRNSVPGMGVSPMLGNLGQRITSSVGNMGNMIGGANIGRNVSGGLSVPNIASRMNLAANTGTGTLNIQGSNRLISGMLQQAPQMVGMLGNSYPTSGGSLSQNQVQGGNSSLGSIGMLHDANFNDNSPFDLNDFPQLSGRPSSAGGPQGQLGAIRKQGVGVSSIVQQNQEFSIQNEDFPALPGYKGSNADYSTDLHHKEQLHDNVPVMQAQHYPMARSAGLSLGGSYPSNRQIQQQSTNLPANNQDLLHLHGSDLFPSSHGTYHSQVQNTGSQNIGLRPLNSPNPASNLGAYEQLIQQYQQPQNQSQLRMHQMSAVTQSYRDQSLKSIQGVQNPPDPFGLLGLLSVIRMNDQDLASLALGIDLTTLGLNLNSPDNLYKTFGSPWSNEPAKGEPEFSIPNCYCAEQPPPLSARHFSKFQLETLFYIFYSMPKDEAQLYAANELYSRGWLYHRDLKLWLRCMEPLVKTQIYERGSYLCFDPNTWDTFRKDNFVLHYEALEKRPTLSSTTLNGR